MIDQDLNMTRRATRPFIPQSDPAYFDLQRQCQMLEELPDLLFPNPTLHTLTCKDSARCWSRCQSSQSELPGKPICLKWTMTWVLSPMGSTIGITTTCSGPSGTSWSRPRPCFGFILKLRSVKDKVPM